MIPWKDFRQDGCYEPEIRLPLTQRNLELHIDHGESQMQRELNSNMLELAHERRLVISQLSLHHIDFNNWHLLRIEDALNQMALQFDRSPNLDESWTTFDPLDALHDLSIPEPPRLDFAPFEIVSDDDQIRLSMSPSMSTTTSSTRALSISDLINHYDDNQCIRSTGLGGYVIEPDDPETTPESEDMDFFKSTLVQVRSRQLPIPLVTLRTHKQTRVRLKSQPRTSPGSEKIPIRQNLASIQYRRIPVNPNTQS